MTQMRWTKLTALAVTVLVAACVQPTLGQDATAQCAQDITMLTSGDRSGPTIGGVDGFRWPVATTSSGGYAEEMLNRGDNALIALPTYKRLWVGLLSDAILATWTIEALDGNYDAVDEWQVGVTGGNRIKYGEGGVFSSAHYAYNTLPWSIFKKLRELDGQSVSYLRVTLDAEPAGRTGCRVIVMGNDWYDAQEPSSDDGNGSGARSAGPTGAWSGTVRITDRGKTSSYRLMVDFDNLKASNGGGTYGGKVTVDPDNQRITVDWKQSGLEEIEYSIDGNSLSAHGSLEAYSDGRKLTTSWDINRQ